MTIVFHDKFRGRKKHAAPKATVPYPVTQYVHASASSVHVQSQAHQPPIPPKPTPYHHAYVSTNQLDYAASPPPLHPGYTPSQQYHPVYGAMPQAPQQYGYPYGSPPFLPVHPYPSTSNVDLATAAPHKEKENVLKSQLNRAGRLASKSYQDLSAQVSSGANKSMTALTTNCIDKPTAVISKKSTQALNQGAALCDLISTKLDAVITSIDDGLFSGSEQDLVMYDPPSDASSSLSLPTEAPTERSAAATQKSSASTKGSNVFSKVWLYSNSRLPPHVPPFKVYMPTYPLLCLAAAYSERVYTPPDPKTPGETETHIAADWKSGTKAMVLKSLPIDDMNTVVFAIRGSQTFMDWAVNYRSEPTSPEGFLDDEGNACHAGFLYVARKMVKPVADRLRVLLQENPARSACSLLITGHSAGGAVAALLYAHMMNTRVESELSYLTGFFKRVHCVTFGAPPVSLLPLRKSEDKRHRKSLFFSFINEGDPVPRADKAVVKSLLKLYSSPAPSVSTISSGAMHSLANFSKLNISAGSQTTTLQTTSTIPSSLSSSSTHSGKGRKAAKASKTSLQSISTSTTSAAPSWPIAPCALCPAGRLVVLRQKIGSAAKEDIEAVTVDDELLRGVVYGDPLKHMMKVYRKRVELLATRAVTASEH